MAASSLASNAVHALSTLVCFVTITVSNLEMQVHWVEGREDVAIIL